MRHGRLTAVRQIGSGNRGAIWLFACDCGNTCERFAQRVFEKYSRISSCGCHQEAVRATLAERTLRNELGQFDRPRRRVYVDGKLRSVK
jgi:hypothetical protein